MSRVGKMPIAVPQGVDVAITAEQITVKGGNGTLSRPVGPHWSRSRRMARR
jgi:large subunit ribosomal protein L6